jgi:hypothetical protein
MGGKTRSETAITFLRKISEKKTDKEAREWVEQTLQMAKDQQMALSVLGTMTITVVPGGGFHYTLSPHLMVRRETLDWVDQALNDAQQYVRELRKRVTERDLATAQQQETEVEVENQEE